MKVPDLNVSQDLDDEELEEKTFEIIEQAFNTVVDEIESCFDVEYESPHPEVAVFRVGNKAVVVKHGDNYIEYSIDGVMVEKDEFIRSLSRQHRKQLRKAIGVYSCLADAQNKYVAGYVLQTQL